MAPLFRSFNLTVIVHVPFAAIVCAEQVSAVIVKAFVNPWIAPSETVPTVTDVGPLLVYVNVLLVTEFRPTSPGNPVPDSDGGTATVKVSAFDVPPALLTVRLCAPGVAELAIEQLALSDVAVPPATGVQVTPAPAATDTPPRLVPVSAICTVFGV